MFIALLSFHVSAQKNDPALNQLMKNSFTEVGIAGLDRLNQDANQKLCSDVDFMKSPAGLKHQEQLQKEALAKIKPPSDGNYIGNWQEGEKIAQNGRGATWTDKPGSENGGSCYNCHQISSKEISYGNLGPSLAGYGKIRGYTDQIKEYTWNRISNSKAYNACSNMPRFAHAKLLTEQQIKDVMALLLDPNSPVNQ